MSRLFPLILAGGAGTRLWPLSRELFPKQFHALFGDKSLLQNTLLRAKAVTVELPIVVCNEDHRFLVAEQCRGAGVTCLSLMLEQAGRNTAPAIALAAHRAIQEDPNALLLFLPSDHLVAGDESFAEAVRLAVAAAELGQFVTFGVRPDRAETGYGYIQYSPALSGVQAVRSFKEKPGRELAESYLAAGDYLWNSGMFVLHAQSFLDELQRLRPAIASAVSTAFATGQPDLDFFRPGKAFLDSPSESIDYAVMEETSKAQVVPVSFRWNDVGSWSAIWDESPRDAHGNCLQGDVVALDTTNSFVLSQDRLVTTIGVSDLVVVDTPDALLISAKDRVQDVKTIVADLKKRNRKEHVVHSEVFRPWGSYETVEDGQRYQVKRIRVKPGASLSLQKHHHRAEHWIVVRGTAEVVCEERTFMLVENESTYIPIGAKHRLTNPGKLDLEMIEVQVGAYLGEDDIVRFDDVYGRVKPG
jgi:mannose-1-phosphate guanylyltransferase / mannose-6-phosphate isomerase